MFLRNLRRIYLFSAGMAGVVLLLCLALALLLPRLINLESVKETLSTEIQRKTGAQVELGRIDLSYFPAPRLVVHHIQAGSRDGIECSIRAISIYPRILPLVSGELKARSVTVRKPRITYRLPPRPAERFDAPVRPSVPNPAEWLAPLAAFLESEVDGGTLEVKNGDLTILDHGNSELFHFRSLNGRASFEDGRLELNVSSGRSDLWESLSFSGWAHTRTFQSAARLVLAGVLPQGATDLLFPDSPLRLGDSRVDLDVGFSSENSRTFSAAFSGSAPVLTIVDKEGMTVLRGGRMEGSLHLDDGRMDASISRLAFDHPRANLTGHFHWDPSAPRVTLDVEGKDTDAASVRSAALTFFRDDRHVVYKIFDILRGGHVSVITYNGEGRHPRQLKKSDHYVIRGRLQEGKILVPRVQLEVSGIEGEVTISKGILEGTGLRGKVGQTQGHGGSLRIGLRGGDAPFHLDVLVDADMAQLPIVLERVARSENLQTELALMQNIQGRGRGRLILGESLRDVQARVEVSNFQLTGLYQRIPYPMELEGTSFLFEGSSVSAYELKGKVGGSLSSGLNLRYSWADGHHVEFDSSKPVTVFLDEIYPILPFADGSGTPRKTIEALTGFVTFHSTEFKGQILQPSDWQFAGTGTIRDLTIHSPAFPGPVHAREGEIDVTQSTLSLDAWQAAILDSSLLVSGRLPGYMTGIDKADLSIQGKAGPEAAGAVYDIVGLPREYRMVSPLSISKSQLAWEKGGNTSFTCDLTGNGGTRVHVDVGHTSGQVIFRRLSIKDGDSDATLGISLQKGELNLGFDGTLSNKSLDRILLKNELLAGWIKGSFRARILPDQPMNSTAQGQLQVAGFQYTWDLKTPAYIHNAVLEADGNTLIVKSSLVQWHDSRLGFKGSIAFSTEGFKLDMDVDADKLDMGKLSDMKEDKPRSSQVLLGNGKKKLQLRGVLRVRSEVFTAGTYTWSPARAEVHLLEDSVDIHVLDARLCGIPTPGFVRVSGDSVRLDIRPNAVDEDLAHHLACFWDKKDLMDGTFDLKGELASPDARGGVTSSLNGEVEFRGYKGRIYRFEVLSKIFSMINVTEIYRGQLPDLVNEGCAYDTIKSGGKVKDGKLVLSESILEGPVVRLVWRGEVDLVKQELNCTVIVSPFKTVDRIVRFVPLLGRLLNGTLVSIPVQVTGSLADPTVIPLSPTAVGSELLQFMKRTFKLPFSLFQPLLNQSREPRPYQPPDSPAYNGGQQ
ncbi:MAG: AsmA-like C-terminal domain-containing protein [Syntrophobacteraceae bacterium]|nr:AsmA-like C-terminal domain-containing protein [Syntrophobacteraceae bacterium]